MGHIKWYIVLTFSLVFFNFHLQGSEEAFLVVKKRGVTYRYVPTDAMVDNWVAHVFPYWEEETFDVFEKVKNRDAIAIDIGAWIGPTAIWLSHHFAHVIAIEPDKVSLECLTKNVRASECENVTICPYPITHENQQVIFGPREDREPELNRSMSYVKEAASSFFDYQITSITLSEMIDAYVKTDPALASKTISFIKCDIEGGEEDILGDLLEYAIEHKVSVYLSFHYSWWKKKSLLEFSELFSLFDTDCTDVVSYISNNPFGSVLFIPNVFQNQFLEHVRYTVK